MQAKAMCKNYSDNGNREKQKEDFYKILSTRYNEIRNLFFSQLPHPDAEDVLQEAIIKVVAIIDKKGLKKDSDYMAYLFLTYRNLIYNKNQKKQRIYFIIDELPESNFTENEEEKKEALQKRKEKEKVIDSIFQYVEDNYSPIESGLFKFYHKTKLTYKQISKLTGFSFSYIWKKNKIILDDIKTVYRNFSGDLFTDDGASHPG